MSLRCPYCHDQVRGRAPRCRACQAAAHAACALEFARCAACGDSRWEELPRQPTPDWGRGDGPTFLRATLDALPTRPRASVRLDLQRRAEPAGGLVAGTLWVDLPGDDPRPGVELVWLGPGLDRRLTLLVARPASRRPELGWRHRVDFRTPAPAQPGARLALDLDRRLRVWPGWEGVEAGRASRQVAG